MNKLALTGTVAKLESLRFTPAGLPLLSFFLLHSSETVQVGVKRRVQCQLFAMLIGELAKSPLVEGMQIRAQGFLTQRSLKSTQLVMHIQKIQIL